MSFPATCLESLPSRAFLGRQSSLGVETETNSPSSAVGAGDTFIAGMLYGLLCHGRDWDDTSKLRFAVNLATSKVQREGFKGLGADIVKPQGVS